MPAAWRISSHAFPPHLLFIGTDCCMVWPGMALTAGATFILNIMRTKCVDYLDETRGAAAKEAQ